MNAEQRRRVLPQKLEAETSECWGLDSPVGREQNESMTANKVITVDNKISLSEEKGGSFLFSKNM